MANDLKHTLNLPVTDFPMRGNLAKREPSRYSHWESINLYEQIQKKNRDNPAYILHDGPPFTNGDVHIGTALNKILKDIILRYKSMRGLRTPYVPGWDCHGLPIEHKVSQKMQQEKKDLSALDIRKACEAFSRDYIEIQRKQFKRLGVMGDWKGEYRTMDPAYEADILRTFAAFVEKGMVYRSKKPVYWSIPCKTALAEAEIEYKDHTSPSIWVKFPVVPADADKLGVSQPLGVVIWTTTPWTIPANLAIAVHPRLTYVEVRHDGQSYLVVEELAASFIAKCGLEGAGLGLKFRGESLENLQARHPFIDRASPIVLAEYVTTESGTGCVHTAPGHGLDDYLTGQNYGLEIYCPLNDDGCYINDGMIPPELVGVTVLERKGKNPANFAVVDLLKKSGNLLKFEKYEHSYPHCWRSKTPVIFRAMDQWFVSIDHNDMRQNLLQAVSEVEWIPRWGENRIRGALESRPDWCISRQRTWGVPIPAFYDEEGDALLDAGIIRALAEKIEQHGTNFWYENTAEAILEGIEIPTEWQDKPLKTGTDTLDVWIDSGSSHRAVLQRKESLSWPADLYLEGSDQHRGWFQSTLWTAMVADGQPPYKKVVTHGFIVNQDGTKVSKSDAGKNKKPMTADSFVNKFGADMVRLWVSSEDYRNDVPLSDEIFTHINQAYRSIRNTFRFQLGNISDFDPLKDQVEYNSMLPLDQWMLHQMARLVEPVTEAYDALEFHKVYQLCNRFCAVTLSAVYHDIIKDRIYTMGRDSVERRSAQTAIYHSFRTLSSLLAPILIYTCDEAWSFGFGKDEYSQKSIHLESWPEDLSDWSNQSLHSEIEELLKIRNLVNEQLEDLRKDKVIGQSLEAVISLKIPEKSPVVDILSKYESVLAELFIVSKVIVRTAAETEELEVEAQRIDGSRCPRCWRWMDHLTDHEDHGLLCDRCHDAI